MQPSSLSSAVPGHHGTNPSAPPGPETTQRTVEPASAPNLRAAEVRARAWENEIADRVARYRRRRTGSDRGTDSEDNLAFDFDSELRHQSRPQEADTWDDEELDDLVLDNGGASATEAPVLDSIHIERGGMAGLRPEDAAEWALEPSDFRVADPEPVEIVLDSNPAEDEPEIIAAARRRLAAPIGLRFVAGMVDGLTLLLSALIFALVFWKSGGQLTIGRHGDGVTNLVVVCILAAFFVIFYFGLFTALAFATPGQSAMGLQVRTLDGEPPDGRAARRRALGYLVSTIPMMLGFVWAVFDVEGLAWHDRVSGTCLVQR
jgi:uncharacterized RDD family membrane protein YckC